MSPYRPKEAVSVKAIQGTWPYATTMTTTAMAAMPTATHCSRRMRSLSTKTPSSTVVMGLMK